MHKTNLKKYIRPFLQLLFGIFIIYSIYTHLGYRGYVKQSIDQNYNSLITISIKGDNLADRLEEFVHLSRENEDNSEITSKLFNNWRVVTIESKSIHSYLYAISTQHMRNEASDWNLLQFSLFRVDDFLTSMTYKFLEHHSYDIDKEEIEKMEAVIKFYRILSENTENNSVDVESILQSIQEPMLIIHHNYLDILERTGR